MSRSSNTNPTPDATLQMRLSSRPLFLHSPLEHPGQSQSSNNTSIIMSIHPLIHLWERLFIPLLQSWFPTINTLLPEILLVTPLLMGPKGHPPPSAPHPAPQLSPGLAACWNQTWPHHPAGMFCSLCQHRQEPTGTKHMAPSIGPDSPRPLLQPEKTWLAHSNLIDKRLCNKSVQRKSFASPPKAFCFRLPSSNLLQHQKP